MCKKLICMSISLFFAANTYALSNADLERIMQAQSQLLTELQQKVSELQGEVDQLRGELQENGYQLEQTIERQKTILQSLDRKPNVPSNTPKMNVNSLAGWSPTGDDKADYNFIVKFVLEGKQTKEAIQAFQAFITEYPKSIYQANANYWLGQLNYNQGKRSDASYYFAIVVKNYPKTTKAAESLYKIGLIFIDQNEKEKAKTILQQVITQYPNETKITAQAREKLASL